MSTLSLEQELQAKKINPTAMRLLVLKFLKQQKGAVSLADIEASFDQSDRVTLYRTVKTFESKGLLHSITTNNVTQYALCAQECDESHHHDTHLHFVCSNCKKTICLTQVSIPKIEIPAGFQLDAIDVVAKGVCKECKS
ncbi:transcriptional repressor [Myroides sp. M-43]|uniref:Fur family transcriptional regulator n=1 Tax=Myroides oncorhynchi TaxID=2893756 RepID=UPI001E30FAF3|nr:transcriptional repressor [Myroides oncorhynchi]MCC9041466.1 transcriptional repressor [Myroides oncorhynchi]